MSANPAASVRSRQIPVWDPLVRWGHWALVIAFAFAYLASEQEAGAARSIHVWSGYAVGGLVILRVVWGFLGTQHARFVDFAYGPVRALRYLLDMATGRARRYLGHSPAGGFMVLVLLACLAGTVATGLGAYGEQGRGPLASVVRVPTARSHSDNEQLPTASSREADEREGGLLAELHDALANLTLGLVILHVLGVGFASVVHHENLAAAMIHGRKRVED